MDSAVLRASWRSWSSFDDPPAGPGWLQLLWTGLFCAVVAVGFTVLGWLVNPPQLRDSGLLVMYGRNLVISLCVGLAIHAIYALVERLMGRARLAALGGWRRTATHIAIPSLGVMVGWPLGLTLVLGAHSRPWQMLAQPRVLVASLSFTLVLSLLAYMVMDLRARRERAERQATQARLALLQGQMEPHFLFNTLANVASLIDSQPALARQMLESFTEYLRGSLQGLRGGRPHTLGDELDLVAAYLRVAQGRMASRLQVQWQVGQGLRGLPLAPLLLQPLVENAVVHGLEPQLDGGSLRILASRSSDGVLQLCVEDDGAGLLAPSVGGQGSALANLRERLSHAHGSAARLSVTPLAPQGTRACLHLPCSAR